MRFFVLAVLWLLAAGLVPLRSAVSSERLEMRKAVYVAEIVRVIDGDTIEVQILLLPGLTQRVHLRLVGIDMPELRAGCEEQRHAAQAAKQALEALLNGHRFVQVQQIRPDKYGGRLDGIMVLSDGRSVAEELRGRFEKRNCGEKEEKKKKD